MTPNGQIAIPLGAAEIKEPFIEDFRKSPLVQSQQRHTLSALLIVARHGPVARFGSDMFIF